MDAGDEDAGLAAGVRLGVAAVRGFFSLDEAERSAAALAPAQREIVLRYVDAAERRLRLVPSFSDKSTAVGGLTLLRDATALLARAYILAHERTADVDAIDRVGLAAELERALESAPSAPEGGLAAVPAISTDNPLYFDRLEERDFRALAGILEATASWLRSQVETRSVANIRGTRWGRRGALVVALILAMRVLVGYVGRWLHPNLALNKPVTQSSSWPGSAASSALVDGETFASRGPEVAHCNVVHTNMEASPWVLIDLQVVRSLHDVRVYNRADHHFDAGLPYVLEVSEDGSTFEAVARRTTHFGATSFDPPWTATLTGKRARFVRVRCEHFLALGEVEVF